MTQAQCLELRSRLEEERQNIEEEYETYHEQERQLSKDLKEKQKLLDDMKNNRKSYPEVLTKARLPWSRSFLHCMEEQSRCGFLQTCSMLRMRNGKMR